MPKLIAQTIDENRRARYANLLEAAVSIALDSGGNSLTITAVAKRAGISRAGVYEYFSSKEEIVADLIIDEIKIWNALLEKSIAGIQDPQEKIIKWIETSLVYVASGRHKLAKELSAIALPSEKTSVVRQAHIQLLTPLISALTELGMSDPTRSAMYINGLIEVATRRFDSGRSGEDEIEYVLKTALKFLAL